MTALHTSTAARVALTGVLAAAVLLPAESNQAVSKHANTDVQADTNPDSAFWRDAPAIFLENDSQGNPVPGFRTEVRSRWTASNLYFLFTCPYTELNLKPEPQTEAETNELWKWDVAEAFIGSDFQNIRRYKEFEVSPQGEWVDLDINLDAPRHEDGWLWNSRFQAAARIDRARKVWYSFMRIPYASIDARPAAGNLLRINFFLSEGSRANHKSLTWQPTRQRTFHVPEAFGTLKLEP
jgi:cellulose/xylan binding protein with CBM9 domain